MYMYILVPLPQYRIFLSSGLQWLGVSGPVVRKMGNRRVSVSTMAILKEPLLNTHFDDSFKVYTCVYIHVHVHVYMYMCTCTCVYIVQCTCTCTYYYIILCRFYVTCDIAVLSIVWGSTVNEATCTTFVHVYIQYMYIHVHFVT